MPSRSWRQRCAPICCLIVLLLGGCGPTTPATTPAPTESPVPPTPDPTSTPGPLTTLTIWHSWDAGEEQIIRNLLSDYHGQHPGVTVRLRRVPVGGILPEYQEAILGGEGPDLLVGRSHWIGRLADARAITPLEDLVETGYWESFYPFAVEGVRYQDHVYAVPYACETVALYYNRDFVGEPPTTTMALLSQAANWPGEEQAGLAFRLSFYNTVGYLYAFGGRLFDEGGHATIDTAETRAWLSWLQAMRASGGVIATDSYGRADALFKGGSVAMIVNGSWALSDYLQSLGSERLGVAPLPMLDQTQAWPTPLVGSRVLMVNPTRLTAHPKETLDLLRFMGGPTPQRLLASRQALIPTWQEIDLSGNDLLRGFVQQAERGRPRPVSPRMEVLWEPIGDLIDNVTSRDVPVDLALQETQQRVEQILLELEEAEGP